MDDQKNTGLMDSAKDGIVSAIRGAGNVGTAVIETIGNLADTAIKGTGEAAGEIGEEAGQKVRDALTGTIAGVKVVLKEPFKAAEKN